jgi:hypothetical protein
MNLPFSRQGPFTCKEILPIRSRFFFEHPLTGS